MKIKWFTFRHLIYIKNILLEFYKEKLYLSFALAVAFAALIYFLNYFFYPSDLWSSFTIEKGIEVLFCEFTDLKRVVRQPVNTFTNIWYAVNAIFFLSKGISDRKKPNSFNLITANPYYSIALGFISIYTFVCSTFFHSSLIAIASTLDFSAVYSIALFPLMYYSHRILLLLRKKPTNVFHPNEVKILLIVFTTIYFVLTFLVPLYYVHPVVLACIILTALGGFYLEKKEPNKADKRYLVLMVVFISIAVFLFKLDFSKVGCDPDSFLQAHSLWHIFNSMTVFYLYLYFRSENYTPAKDKKIKSIRENLQ
ncbi:MAG: ceramidase domain-containing protein [Chitinophagales bacterium]